MNITEVRSEKKRGKENDRRVKWGRVDRQKFGIDMTCCL